MDTIQTETPKLTSQFLQALNARKKIIPPNGVLSKTLFDTLNLLPEPDTPIAIALKDKLSDLFHTAEQSYLDFNVENGVLALASHQDVECVDIRGYPALLDFALSNGMTALDWDLKRRIFRQSEYSDIDIVIRFKSQPTKEDLIQILIDSGWVCPFYEKRENVWCYDGKNLSSMKLNSASNGALYFRTCSPDMRDRQLDLIFQGPENEYGPGRGTAIRFYPDGRVIYENIPDTKNGKMLLKPEDFVLKDQRNRPDLMLRGLTKFIEYCAYNEFISPSLVSAETFRETWGEYFIELMSRINKLRDIEFSNNSNAETDTMYPNNKEWLKSAISLYHYSTAFFGLANAILIIYKYEPDQKSKLPTLIKNFLNISFEGDSIDWISKTLRALTPDNPEYFLQLENLLAMNTYRHNRNIGTDVLSSFLLGLDKELRIK